MPFGYQSEKFKAARAALMLPHPKGESQSLFNAFIECDQGIRDLEAKGCDENSLGDDQARGWFREIKEFMDSSGLSDPEERGLFKVKAESLDEGQKAEFSNAVDELAHYFSREVASEDNS